MTSMLERLVTNRHSSDREKKSHYVQFKNFSTLNFSTAVVSTAVLSMKRLRDMSFQILYIYIPEWNYQLCHF